MAIDFKTPGVHVVELPATGPIAGVGTSTAAFIGPAQQGPVGVPTKVVNWTQFRDTFGDYISTPPVYLAYAVRGFFDNGGTTAYIVRVSTAKKAFKDLLDRGQGATALHVEAKVEGPAGELISVQVLAAQIVAAAANARVRKGRAQLEEAIDDVITLLNASDAAQFAPGDWVTIEGTTERVPVDRIRDKRLFLTTALAADYPASATTRFARIADVQQGQRRFRVQNGAGIEPGSIITLDDGTTAAPEPPKVVQSVSGEMVTLAAPVTRAFALGQNDPIVGIQSTEFGLRFTRSGVPPETFSPLSMDTRHSRFWGRIVSSALVDVTPPPAPNPETPPRNLPAVMTNAAALAGSAADNIVSITTNHYRSAVAALEKVDDVNIVAIPDRNDPGLQGELVAHCERLGDRFAVLDVPRGSPPFAPTNQASAENHRGGLSSARGFAALYYPHLVIKDPASASGDEELLVPASGHVTGIYARADALGVHNAPANEEVVGAVALERVVDDAEQGDLNIAGVNVLRMFPGRGRPLVWGARTITPRDETPWRYVPVRRLFIYVEESLKVGLRGSVFRPNDLALWKRLDRTISEFLTRVWRSGALFGATPEEAYYVKIDEENNPQPVRALGQVIIEVGMAPVRPAEFIVIRMAMWAGGAEISEE